MSVNLRVTRGGLWGGEYTGTHERGADHGRSPGSSKTPPSLRSQPGTLSNVISILKGCLDPSNSLLHWGFADDPSDPQPLTVSQSSTPRIFLASVYPRTLTLCISSFSQCLPLPACGGLCLSPVGFRTPTHFLHSGPSSFSRVHF